MLKKITVEQLRMGMHIHEFCGSWMDHPFWRTKFILNDPDDLRQIRACGVHELWIDVQKGIDVAGPDEHGADAPGDTAPQQIDILKAESCTAETSVPTSAKVQRVPLAEEVQRATKLFARSKTAVASMFQEARMGRAIDHEMAGELVEEVVSSVLRNPCALINLARLKTKDDYTYMHSVAVCALMVALSRQLELDPATTRAAGMAGLLHDLGKAQMPIELINKPDKLTDGEFGLIKNHPAEGLRILLAGGAASEIALDVCLHHHERIDGSGYPEGLKGDEISLYAKMSAVCDVYDAVTSNRPYKAAWNPAEAIHKMAESSAIHFDEHVFRAFVKIIGIYPTGSLVRLHSGRLAVVIEQSPASLLTPTVKVFFSVKARTYLPPEIIDLSHSGTKEKIASLEDANRWGIKDLDRFWTNP